MEKQAVEMEWDEMQNVSWWICKNTGKFHLVMLDGSIEEDRTAELEFFLMMNDRHG